MSTLRISGGTLRGRRVPVPPRGVRPTSERARQAFFNIIAPRIVGAHFLDLFAGSGIFSLEALSRGAVSSVAVDSSGQNLANIERIAKDLELPLRTVRGEIPGVFSRLAGTAFDIVYADPPYAFAGYDEMLAAIGERLELADGALVAVEHRRRGQPFKTEAPRLRFLRRAEYGEVWISIFEYRTAPPGPRPAEEPGSSETTD